MFLDLPLYVFQCFLAPLKILFQQVFISSSNLFTKHGESSCFFCSFKSFFSSKVFVGWTLCSVGGFLSLTLLVQFNSINVVFEILSAWSLNSSLLFVLLHCFNLRTARYRNLTSLLSSHEFFLKKLDAFCWQLLQISLMLSNALKLTMRIFPKTLSLLPSISQSDDAPGNRTRIRGGIPKIYLKETWNMVCGRRA